MNLFLLSSSEFYGAIIISMQHDLHPRPREVKCLAQGHKAREVAELGLSGCKALALSTVLTPKQVRMTTSVCVCVCV
jgi:hypothetical protein